jgi:hypothetical protein
MQRFVPKHFRALCLGGSLVGAVPTSLLTMAIGQTKKVMRICFQGAADLEALVFQCSDRRRVA